LGHTKQSAENKIGEMNIDFNSATEFRNQKTIPTKKMNLEEEG